MALENKYIAELPAAESVSDTSLFVAEQAGASVKVTGAQIKGFAQNAVNALAATAVSVGPDAQAGVEKTVSGGTVQLKFSIPRGRDGVDGVDGQDGADGRDGTDGQDGTDGKSFDVKDYFDTLDALQTAHPTGSPGDAYIVGTGENNVVYLWSESAGAWTNIGHLEGPPGPTGAQGPVGPTGPQGPTGAGVPTGGTAGQVLAKNTAADYDTHWIDPPEGSGGGGDSGEYAPKNSPVFTGSVSMGRKEGTTVGASSAALGGGLESSGDYSFTEGYYNINSGVNTHVEGGSNFLIPSDATSDCHVEGFFNVSGNMAKLIVVDMVSWNGKTRLFTEEAIFGDDGISVGSIINIVYINSDRQLTLTECTITEVNTEKDVFLDKVLEVLDRTRSYILVESTEQSKSSVCHLEGAYNMCSGEFVHVEGEYNVCTGNISHVEGEVNVCTGEYSHVEGFGNKCNSDSNHIEGGQNTCTGDCSHVEGDNNVCSSSNSHVEGSGNTCSTGRYSHVEGDRNTCKASRSHAEGCENEIGEDDSGVPLVAHVEGYKNVCTGVYSHAEGSFTEASWAESHTEGCYTVASNNGTHSGGLLTVANQKYQMAIGIANVISESATDKLTIGKGTYSGYISDGNITRANCFRVTNTGVYASGDFNASGADYAEMFEWADGNPDGEDRAGRFVTLDGAKIRLAGPEDDYIIGVVSGNPSVVGDVHDDQWQGMYLYDVFGRPLWEDVEIPDRTGHNGAVIDPAHTEHRQRLNPDYDNTQKYIPRSERPEWDAVGLLGKLVAVDDGGCEANGWCTVGAGGIAVRADSRTRYRVMERLDESHVRILIL